VFESCSDQVIYCEHGNQFDPTNAIADYNDPLDTPLGDHIVTDIVRRLSPLGHISWNINLQEASYIFPLVSLPAWIVGRVFYRLLTWGAALALAWAAAIVVVPILAILLFGSRTLPDPGPFWPGTWWRAGADVGTVFVEMGWDLFWLLAVICLFYVAVQRTIRAVLGFLSKQVPGAEQGTAGEQATPALLESDSSPPMQRDVSARAISLFVSGHSHAPSITVLRRRDGRMSAVVNTGCWLKRLQPVPAHLGAPPVFVAAFVQSHVRVSAQKDGLAVELWQRPRRAVQDLPLLERLAILGRRAHEPELGETSVVQGVHLP
jgi:hypothetical protein